MGFLEDPWTTNPQNVTSPGGGGGGGGTANPFWGIGTDPYYKNYFTQKNMTPDFLDTMAASPGAQRSLLWSNLKNARFGPDARLGGAYSSYLENNANLMSDMFGLGATLGLPQNPKGAFESYADLFGSQFRAPTTGEPNPDMLRSRRKAILDAIAGGGDRVRLAEGDVEGSSANSRAQGAMSLAQQVGDMLAGQLPAEAIAALFSQGNLSRLYNRYQTENMGKTNVNPFNQWLVSQYIKPNFG